MLSFCVGSSGVAMFVCVKVAGRAVCRDCHVSRLMCDVIVRGFVVRDHVFFVSKLRVNRFAVCAQ